jgi:HD-GYP domain-containing protein (c-di-GMP phosphodiesterase class II)
MAAQRPVVRPQRAAGVLHDIGKLGISDKILHKPGKLDDDE